jgi:hypothetical protein
MRALCFGLLVSGTVLGIGLACGPPSSFEGLAGGDAGSDAPDLEPEDAEAGLDKSLPPPRPIAPLSATWVDGSRPHFKWELVAGTIGARVELCSTRACDGDKKTYDAVSDLDLPDELAPGVWFWHLFSKTVESIGTTASATWEVLVRGGPGGSTLPGGSFVDVDGDGRGDLVTTRSFTDAPVTEVLVLLATNADSTAFKTLGSDGFPIIGPGVFVPNPAVAVTDTDGDGLADVTVADLVGPPPALSLTTYFGTSTGLNRDKFLNPKVPPTTELPAMQGGPELDGDGWGDVVYATSKEIIAVYGTARGLGPLSYIFATEEFPPDAGFPPNVTLAIQSGFDRNADGLFDLALSWPLPDGPIDIFPGAPDRINIGAVLGTTIPSGQRPTRFANADVDGDGKVDLAYATTVDGKPSICVFRASDLPAATPTCWSPASPGAGFGSAIAAGDLEGDGKDEVLVGSDTGGIDVVRLGDTGLTADHVDTPFGAQLTVIFPGRPGPATWAATRSDGSAIQIFKGSTQSTTLPADPFSKWGTTLR